MRRLMRYTEKTAEVSSGSVEPEERSTGHHQNSAASTALFLRLHGVSFALPTLGGFQ
jgi:hypothetical protein